MKDYALASDARAARDKAIDDVSASESGVSWIADNLPKMVSYLQGISGREFTTDELWRLCGTPPEKRVMGAAIRILMRRGIIEDTGAYVASNRREAHARPIKVWRSV